MTSILALTKIYVASRIDLTTCSSTFALPKLQFEILAACVQLNQLSKLAEIFGFAVQAARVDVILRRSARSSIAVCEN